MRHYQGCILLLVAHRFSQWLSLPIVIDFACWKSISPLLDYPDTTRAKLFVPCKCKRHRLPDEARQGRFPLEEVERRGGEKIDVQLPYGGALSCISSGYSYGQYGPGTKRNVQKPRDLENIFFPTFYRKLYLARIVDVLTNTWSHLKIERAYNNVKMMTLSVRQTSEFTYFICFVFFFFFFF